MTTPWMSEHTSDLVHPRDLSDLASRSISGGRIVVSGHASYQGVRVDVVGVSPRRPAVEISGPLSLPQVQSRHDDVQTGGSSGDVPFDALDEFWLTRTTICEVITDDMPLPGVFATIDGLDVGVADTCGTVSQQGVPLLQVFLLAGGTPSGDHWVQDDQGSRTRMVHRDRVSTVRSVEWTAVWRDLTVFVASISGDTAVVFADRGGVPQWEFPEIARQRNLRSGWSAIVPVDQLSLRSWTSAERPLGAGCVAGTVGLVGERTVRVARATDPGDVCTPADGAPFVAQKLRGETVTDEFVVCPRTARVDSAWEWRAGVDASALRGLQRISTTTTWKGETRSVVAYREAEGLVYFDNDTAPIAETTPLRYSASTIGLTDLSVALALG
jgi:hypothetical protein